MKRWISLEFGFYESVVRFLLFVCWERGLNKNRMTQMQMRLEWKEYIIAFSVVELAFLSRVRVYVCGSFVELCCATSWPNMCLCVFLSIWCQVKWNFHMAYSNFIAALGMSDAISPRSEFIFVAIIQHSYTQYTDTFIRWIYYTNRNEQKQ